MKKSGVLHAQLSEQIAGLGHKDMVLIGDAGMPIPKGVPIIDLALCCGVPTFRQVMEVFLQEEEAEAYYYAVETEKQNPEIYDFLQKILDGKEKECMSHEELKLFSKQVKFAIRTGEITPYANVILRSGVVF